MTETEVDLVKYEEDSIYGKRVVGIYNYRNPFHSMSIGKAEELRDNLDQKIREAKEFLDRDPMIEKKEYIPSSEITGAIFSPPGYLSSINIKTEDDVLYRLHISKIEKLSEIEQIQREKLED